MHLSDFEAQDFNLIRSLAEQTISVPVTDIQRLPGSMSYNYKINRKHILKLPNEYTNQEDWLRYAQCAPVLQNHFTFQIPMLQLKTIYTPDKETLLASFYPEIKGDCIMNNEFLAKDRRYKQTFFEQLSDAAAQIHAVSPKELPLELPTKIDYLEVCFFKNFKGDDYFPKKLFRKLLHNSFFGFGESGLRTSLLIHTDLHPGNILLDDKNKLIAILDFDMMVRGDRFLEFRPNLYTDPQDIDLFHKIYQRRTGIKVDSNEVSQQEITKYSLSWFYSLCKLYQFLPTSVRDRKMEYKFEKKMFQKDLSQCI